VKALQHKTFYPSLSPHLQAGTDATLRPPWGENSGWAAAHGHFQQGFNLSKERTALKGRPACPAAQASPLLSKHSTSQNACTVSPLLRYNIPMEKNPITNDKRTPEVLQKYLTKHFLRKNKYLIPNKEYIL